MTRDEEMAQHLRPYRMLDNPRMQRVRREGMGFPAGREIARTYGPCNAVSLQIMAASASRLEDPSLIRVMVLNMYDELGGEDPEQSHIKMFERFMRAVDVDPDNCPVVPGGRVDTYRNAFLAVRDEPSEYEACGFMHGFEAVFPYICRGVYEGLMKSKLVTPEAAYFFDYHATGDMYHSSEILEVMKRGADTPEKWDACIRRSKHSASLIYRLFDEILSSI